METDPQKCSMSALQKLLINIHGKLIDITEKHQITDTQSKSEEYLDRLLHFLETELKKYGMFSKFENMSEEFRRKELFILLTKHLGIRLFQKEAGDIDSCRESNKSNPAEENLGVHNTFSSQYDFRKEFAGDSIPTMQKLFLKSPFHEKSIQNNLHIQYQLYSNILHCIQQELDGLCRMESDPITNVLLVGVCIREFSKLTKLHAEQRRHRLLQILASRLLEKCNQITLTDMIRDARIETEIFFNQQQNAYPKQSWAKMITMGPKQTLLHLLYNSYPLFLIEMFLDHISVEKESIILKEERIFRTKIMVLKTECLETVESIRKHLRYKKYINKFLSDYVKEFKHHYDKTESEFYRQEILKSEIDETLLGIKIE